ncbi:hypothetical protein N0X72_03880 [Streptomyces carpaticus]|uniref:OAA-family lectin sugar binding domain-containing protein n=2 Tax=Streptomyces TaxID=1883 RepID=A0A1I6QRT2_9ACTN|nr:MULTISPECIES: hypothetical protein [Streptomyces]QKV67925.1 hypothetical protein HUT13_03400 [Streptomyces harbinensis]UWM48219.1 hypothetical protein N0X72_03880 [Streptomyces carpaticus]SFS55115.1 hypothetical protein SAMN05444716_102232 [Streptomyces harbinensis]
MATYETELHTGGGGWQPDEPLSISITNRESVVPENGAPSTGTTVTWSGDQGNGSVTFFDEGTRFEGTAQFPGEGPVGYRGQLTE